MIGRIALVALALVACGAAAAQTPSALGESAKGMIGTWEFSNADRDRICYATFKSDATPVGYKVEFDKNCLALFPIIADVAGWIFPENDLLRLVDAHKKTLVEFGEVEDNIYEAPTPGLGVLFLQNAASAPAPEKSARQVAGNWVLKRESGGTLCRLTLTTTAADDNFTLSVQPGCDPTIARLNFGQWRMDRDDLMIYPARGNPWRFEAEDDNSWRRVPESADPILLVKQ
jgi:hypothetical protein